ncbi:hypothetical protein AM571_PC00327 (plasmid) [Rhizobium etli 8C-3]|uniref:Uncharacterized protein n=1 Tax=Rhizobium etli 8C-3 TaxID=538025 RepID=A0A1L5PCQ0_RHIET|nr:hypothetical protein AM571_PC00327 [Rhizobium etli 8C-3]
MALARPSVLCSGLNQAWPCTRAQKAVLSMEGQLFAKVAETKEALQQLCGPSSATIGKLLA